jgi:hypothetical protein
MRSKPLRCSLAALVLLAFAACSRPSTVDDLRAAIDAYRAGPVKEGDEPRIDALFAKLDAEIAELRADAAAKSGDARTEREGQAEALAEQRSELHSAFVAARFGRLGDAAGDALRSAGEALGQTLEEAGRKLRESSKAPAPEPSTPSRSQRPESPRTSVASSSASSPSRSFAAGPSSSSEAPSPVRTDTV